MIEGVGTKGDGATGVTGERNRRADARRNVDGLLRAAMEVFAEAGVDAPSRVIAARAGVGVGTLYRHYPQRSDLIVAAFRNEVEACAEAATVLGRHHPPFPALASWLHRYAEFIAAKLGLSAALHSGDPAYQGLPQLFESKLLPAARTLLAAAAASGEVREDVDALELLYAIASVSLPIDGLRPGHAHRMVDLLVAGLRSRAAIT